MDRNLLDRIYNTIKSKKIAVIGDFAIDFYFNIETNTQEFSVETSKEVFHALQPVTSLGGAGNVCKNLAALGNKPAAFGMIGNDLFGREMIHLLQNLKISHENLQIDPNKGTPVYSKPMEKGIEFNRIDFGTKDKIEKASLDSFYLQTCLQMSHFDGIILNEQFLHPLLSKEHLIQLQQVINDSSIFAIADLRSLGEYANNVVLKINLKEFSQLVNIPINQLTDITQIKQLVKTLLKSRSKGILLTMGEMGILYADHEQMVHEKALPLKGPIDTVGAGDTVVASFTAAVLSGASASEACQFANLCAHLSIHKIGETGSANWEEIMNYEI